MASAFSHAIVAVALGTVVQPRQAPWWYWTLGAFVSMAPDLDVVGFRFGVRYEDVLGHRGFSHSIFFALIFAGLFSLAFIGHTKVSFPRLFAFLFVATASHGILDAMTNGGLGIAFLSPFSNERLFFPFHPIQVSPIGVERFFSEEGMAVIHNEVKWLWIPSAFIVVIANVVRRFRGSDAA